MITLFEAKVRYRKPDPATGAEKPITEAYLFDALTYTEAEARVFEEMPKCISGDFQVVSITKAKYSELFEPDGGDRWYKVKTSFLSIDEKSGREKRVSQQVLILASDVKDAVDKTIKEMGGDTPDFQVNLVQETTIMDYYPLPINVKTKKEGE